MKSHISYSSTTSAPRPIPALFENEREDGRILGAGEFCVVREVVNICLFSRYTASDEDEEKFRQFMSSNVKRRDDGMRYAVKKIRTDQLDCERLKGLYVMKTEIRLLKKVNNHPNIIKLRAIASASSNANDSNKVASICLLIDRLPEILTDRIYNCWSTTLEKISKRKKIKYIFNSKKYARLRIDMMIERLYVAYDLANAMQYLHEHRVIHRDLKPENIGFDVRGDLKVFDLGLSRELPSEGKSLGCCNDLYKMTGLVGTLLYMAPEVALSKDYGISSDVFSFGIILWEILTCTRPFEALDTKSFHELVILNGTRPPLSIEYTDEWPKAIIDLVQDCWDENPLRRCTSEFIVSYLLDEITSIETTALVLNRNEMVRNRSINSLVEFINAI